MTDNYSLYFNKTVSTDTGEYSCIINDRHSPESIIDLLIQGKHLKWTIYLLKNRVCFTACLLLPSSSIVLFSNIIQLLLSSSHTYNKWTQSTQLRNFVVLIAFYSFSLFIFTDVPAPPERPLITYFTSRQVNLSWAHLQDSRNDPVIDFIIQIR